jgi:hypothetical protein
MSTDDQQQMSPPAKLALAISQERISCRRNANGALGWIRQTYWTSRPPSQLYCEVVVGLCGWGWCGRVR